MKKLVRKKTAIHFEYKYKTIEQDGYIIHLERDEKSPFGINFHTHGLLENYNHLELQFVFLLDDFVPDLFDRVIKDIYAGKVFKEKLIFRGYLDNNMPLSFKKINSKLLRLIIPDAKGIVLPDKMTYPFNKQWD